LPAGSRLVGASRFGYTTAEDTDAVLGEVGRDHELLASAGLVDPDVEVEHGPIAQADVDGRAAELDHCVAARCLRACPEPDDFVAEILRTEDLVADDFEVVRSSRVSVEVHRAGRLQHPVDLQ
jgi:hypothetical protein